MRGTRPVGIRRGWGGLLNLNPEDPESYEPNFINLDKNKVRTIDRTGGRHLPAMQPHESRQGQAQGHPQLSGRAA